MGKKKEGNDLTIPKAADVPSAEALVQRVAAARAKCRTAAERATKDGALDRSDPTVRAARKRLKRSQRALRRELRRVARIARPAPAPAETEGAEAPAES